MNSPHDFQWWWINKEKQNMFVYSDERLCNKIISLRLFVSDLNIALYRVNLFNNNKIIRAEESCFRLLNGQSFGRLNKISTHSIIFVIFVKSFNLSYFIVLTNFSTCICEFNYDFQLLHLAIGLNGNFQPTYMSRGRKLLWRFEVSNRNLWEIKRSDRFGRSHVAHW